MRFAHTGNVLQTHRLKVQLIHSITLLFNSLCISLPIPNALPHPSLFCVELISDLRESLSDFAPVYISKVLIFDSIGVVCKDTTVFAWHL